MQKFVVLEQRTISQAEIACAISRAHKMRSEQTFDIIAAIAKRLRHPFKSHTEVSTPSTLAPSA